MTRVMTLLTSFLSSRVSDLFLLRIPVPARVTSRRDETMKLMTSSADASSGSSGRGDGGRADDLADVDDVDAAADVFAEVEASGRVDDFADVIAEDDAAADVVADVEATAVVFFFCAILIQ